MNKYLRYFLPILLLSIALFFSYQFYFGGKSYYTKITTTGERFLGTAPTGEKYTEYDYTQLAYNAKGEKTIQKLNEFRANPLRKGAYLKLKVNTRKGVLSWQEVPEKQVPTQALQQLNE